MFKSFVLFLIVGQAKDESRDDRGQHTDNSGSLGANDDGKGGCCCMGNKVSRAEC